MTWKRSPKTYKILNGIFETNNEEVKPGTGALLPLPKPKKIQGQVKDQRPITLLEAIIKQSLQNLHG